MSRERVREPVGQFGRPRGLLGRLAGQLMAITNRPLNRWAVEVLGVRSEDHILEIGFGPGHLIQLLAERAAEGFVAGVDLSEVMVEQAARRNRRAVQQGRVELRQGSVSSLPYEDGRFDKVVAVNTVQFWPDPESDLREVRRVLKPGGTLVLGLRLKNPARRFLGGLGHTEEEVAAIEALLAGAGFAGISTRRYQQGQERAAYLVAARPPAG